jgi:hypothetical protein
MTPSRYHGRRSTHDDPRESYEATPDRSDRILFFLTVGLLGLGGLLYLILLQF